MHGGENVFRKIGRSFCQLVKKNGTQRFLHIFIIRWCVSVELKYLESFRLFCFIQFFSCLRFQSFKGAKAAPPETILERKTVPGAFWPLQGSKGHVTRRLRYWYPVFVDSVTVDHVSSELVHSHKHQTAPKTMKVIGNPACSKSDNCYALGFDMNDPIEIARIDYDIEGSTI
jgi:hypothetical protein